MPILFSFINSTLFYSHFIIFYWLSVLSYSHFIITLFNLRTWAIIFFLIFITFYLPLTNSLPSLLTCDCLLFIQNNFIPSIFFLYYYIFFYLRFIWFFIFYFYFTPNNASSYFYCFIYCQTRLKKMYIVFLFLFFFCGNV